MKKILITFLTIFTILSAGEFTASGLDSVSANYLAKIPFQLEYKILQQYQGSDAYGETVGQFYLHNKNTFRVNYPNSQILFDGTWLWSIDKVNRQIIVEEFDPSSSLRLIYNVLNGNMAEYDIQGIDDSSDLDSNLIKVELKSKDENSFFKSMFITVDPLKKEIHNVEYVDFQGTKIIIEFLEYYAHQIDEKVLFEVKNIQEDDFIDLRP